MKCILIVDVSEQDRLRIGKILCDGGCSASCAPNGAEALALARQQPPDLVLSATAMPGMDGLALCREWRSDERLRSIPFILFTTARASSQDEQLALDAGADRFVLLPQEPPALIGIIQEVLDCRYAVLVHKLEQRITELEAANQQLVQDTRRMRETKALLRQSEERWRLIIETEPECVKLLGPDGSLLQMNPAGLRMIEADSMEQVANQCVYPLIVPEHRAAFQDLTERVFRGESGMLEFQIVGLKGTNRWMETHSTPLRNEHGAVISALAVTRDITVRKQVEAARQQSQEQLKRLFQSSPLPTLLYSAEDGRIVAVNVRFLELFQCTKEDVVGRTGQELGIWTDPNARDRLLGRLEKEKHVQSFEARLRSRAGAEHDMLLSAQVIEVPHGTLVMVQAHDITDRKQAEARVKESLSLLEATLESTADGILVADGRGRMVRFNQKFIAMWRLPSEVLVSGTEDDALQMVLAQLNEPEQFLSKVRELYDHPTVTSFDLLSFKDGRVFERYSQPHRLGETIVGRVWSFRDVTERRQAEAQLQRQHTLLHSVVESTSDAVFAKDLDGRYLLINTAGAQAVGRPPSEVIGRTDEEIIPLESAKRFRQTDAEVIASGKLQMQEEKALLPMGVRHFLANKTPWRDAAGRIIGTIGVARDITERKQAEERIVAFSDLGRKLSAVETAHGAGEIIVEVADKLIGWDACVLDLYSAADDLSVNVLCKDTIDGRRVDVQIEPASQSPTPMARRILEHGAELILRTEPAGITHDTIPFGDVSRPSLSILIVPVRDGGRTVGILSVQSYQPKAYTPQDLELLQSLADHCSGALNRLRAEEEVRRLAAFPQLNPNPVLELTSEGVIHYFNGAARHLAAGLGFTHPAEMLPPETASIVRTCLATGQAQQRLEVPYGRRVISWSFCPIPAQGVVHCYAADVTERQQLEGQLRQAQKMEAIGTLAGGIAHDFNNLLGVMLGNAELARMDLTDGEPALMSIDEILRTGQRAKELVQRILTFSRPQENKLRPTQLPPVLEEVARLLRSTLPAGVSLTFHSASKVSAVQADAAQIQQAILNLATNAWHAMEGQVGRIEIRLEDCQVETGSGPAHPELHPGPYVRLSFSDNGKGMDATTLGRIFEPFFTTKAPGDGTGLGLSLVHGIMRSHGGVITVESEPGRGTTFHLYFPASTEPVIKDAVEPVAPTALRGRGEHILYLDDEQALVHLAKRFLERLGYRVTGHTQPAEALAAFHAAPLGFDLVITDFNMPGLSGMEVARQLMRNRPGLPVVMLSGFLQTTEMETARAMGIREIILKPNTSEELMAAVERLLPGR